MAGEKPLDRRNRQDLDVLRTKLWYANALRLWRGTLPERPAKQGAKPLQDRMFFNYERGENVPKDGVGSYVDQMEAAVPGSAALFRSPVWDILRGVSLGPKSVIKSSVTTIKGESPSPANVTTFADLETCLVIAALKRQEGGSADFGGAITALEAAVPGLRHIPEIEPQAENFTIAFGHRLSAWRLEVKDRDSAMLPPLSSSTTSAKARTRHFKPSSREKGQALSVGWRYVHLMLALTLLCVAAVSSDEFGPAAAMLMFATNLACAFAPKVAKFKTVWE